MQIRILLAALLLISALPSVPALAETKEEATVDCETRIGLGLGSCRCFIDDWMTYSEDTRGYIAAMANSDKAKVAEVRARISARDLDRGDFWIATIGSKFSC
jgi:hypothetical protein